MNGESGRAAVFFLTKNFSQIVEAATNILLKWATAFATAKLPFNHEATTPNIGEFNDLCGKMRETQTWLRGKGFTAQLNGKAGEWTRLTCVGFKFRVTYAAPKPTKVTMTSIAAHGRNREGFGTQKHLVALFLIEQTAKGMGCNIRTVRDYFRGIGREHPLGERSSVSRAMNDLKRDGATIGGTEYRMSQSEVRKDEVTGEASEFFLLLPVKSGQVESGQFELF